MAWSDDSKRTDVIIFNEKDHLAELEKDLKFGMDINPNTKEAIKKVVKYFWDYFIMAGEKRTILGYELGIDTRGAKHMCYHKPSYGPYESKVILQQVQQLFLNGWIERYEAPWGSMVVLEQKSHQEHITDIANFV